MGDPQSATSFLFQTLGLIVIGVVVEIVYRIRGREATFARPVSPVKSAMSALAAVFIGVGFIWAIFLAFADQPQAEAITTTPSDIPNKLILAAILVLPSVIAIRANRESLDSVGITIKNLGFPIAIGAGLAAIALVETGIEKSWSLEFGETQLWSFLRFTIVGFAEEFLFRGYLQSRLEAWLGTSVGWLLASVLMALSHVAQRITMLDMSLSEALVSSLALISVSLFLGFVFVRTRNILAPGIAHTFANWLVTL